MRFAGRATSLLLLCVTDADRETVNFDFAWRLGGIKHTASSVGLDATTNSRICTLTKQISKSACKLGVDYGCNDDNTMWAKNGCRGEFSCGTATNVYCASSHGSKETCKCTYMCSI